MSKGNKIAERHPIEPEELMAYLDGELPLERASEAAAHLEHCRDCQGVAADLQGVSRTLTVWQVESGKDAGMPQRIVEALEERGRTGKKDQVKQPGWRGALRLPRLPRWAWGAGIAVVSFGILLVVGLSLDIIDFPLAAKKVAAPEALPARMDTATISQSDYLSRPGLTAPEQVRGGGGGGRNSVPITQGPMIVRTAGLTLVTKEFEKTRGELDRILKLHGGYVGQLGVSAPANSGRTLTATLRIPAEQLDAALAELKKLGRVENESQSGEEVTQRYVDLQARLANARNTEQQLTDILRNRTGKLSDVLEVEQELDRVRGEIEEMEAERKNLAHQVDFATLNMTLTEEFEKPLQGVPVSTLTRIHNAAVEGYTSMVDGLVSVILFLFSLGPTLLLWGAILFFPARAIWRRWRARAA